MAEMRLQRYLARAGVAARRKAEHLILRGAVSVNGRKVTELGSKVDPEVDQVTVHGEAVYPDENVYVVLNKPKACITAVSDPEGRRTVMEFVPGLPPSVVPVGRLDFYSEGVLLFTNDGELAAALTAPRTHVEKTYHVKLMGSISEADLDRLREGVRLDDRTTTRPAQVDRLRSQSKHHWLVITITEGKSRQIHRMLEALGHRVAKLQRVAFADITFHGLRVGDARELTQSEVNDLREKAGLARSSEAASRGSWEMKREETEVQRRARDRAREAPTPNPTPGGSRRGAAKMRARTAEARGDGKPARDDRFKAPARAASSSGPRGPSRTGKPGAGTRSAPPSRTGKPGASKSAGTRSAAATRSSKPGASKSAGARGPSRSSKPGASKSAGSRSAAPSRSSKPGPSKSGTRSAPPSRSGKPGAGKSAGARSAAATRSSKPGARGTSRGSKPGATKRAGKPASAGKSSSRAGKAPAGRSRGGKPGGGRR